MTSRRIIFISCCIIGALLAFRYCEFKKNDTSSLESDTNLIQQQIVNVGKLVVTEGHFSEVLTYKDQQSYFMNMLSFQKKALLVVNADVTVAYDLRKVTYDIDQKNKVITIKNIPKEEIKISPDIKFYDIDQSSMNPFTGDDYNKINKAVKANLAKKIEKSTLTSNAKNRLVSELSKILILTDSMGWTLVYNGETIKDERGLNLNIQG
ncbi:DUF4230 domain-containing protein [Flavobacterium sp. MAH-1]|uniref:DUF4230 domain-containing protein n=1 Tax=Flavobacterium agri TaxID=2743471 RepID=A0A7Y9C7Y6_9FLAO|nr:DUF4230 domain-containing protein [Flavobacterium agri]NUY81828.1 DUF4230 domain-containing protein [Flavobacterium agri]NYA71852.1 DUF4230 domain-containing protein [Flavobacterium agri]